MREVIEMCYMNNIMHERIRSKTSDRVRMRDVESREGNKGAS